MLDNFNEPDLASATNSADTSVKPNKEVQSDKMTKAAEANWNAYTRARDSGHSDWVLEADKFDDFYRGEQWSVQDVTTLKEEGRPHLTINKILPTINTWVGEQTSRRADVRFKPKKHGLAAFALTKLSMAIDDANQAEWRETEIFTDGCITDRGYYQVRIDTENNLLGDITYRVLNPRQVLPDPSASSYDPAEWREWTYVDWVSMDEIANTYGKKAAEKIRDTVAKDTGGYGVDSIMLTSHRFGSDHVSDSWQCTVGENEGKYIKKVRLLIREHKRHERVPHFMDMETADVRKIPQTWDDDKIQDFAQRTGLSVIMRTATQIYVTVSVDKIAIHHSVSPYKTFSLIPYFPYFRRGNPIGVVRNLISSQEQFNKLESQELHIVNTTANSGWTMEQGSLTNMTSDDLREEGAKTGLVLEYAPGRAPPEKIQPNQVPTGIDRISAKAANNIKEISSINDAMLGTESPEVSGVALRLKQSRGGVQIAGPMDNLKRTRFLLAKKKLELIQQFYVEERVIQYIDMTDPENPDQELIINQVTATGQILNDVTLGEYEITVGSMPARDVYEESQFAEALELRNAGVQIPDDVVIEASTLHNKNEIAERVRQATGQGTPTPEEQQMLEFQQNYQLQMQIIEMDKAKMELANLEAELALVNAKAAKEGATDSRLLEELESRIAQKREELDLRMELAKMTNATKITLAKINNDATLVNKLVDAGQKQTPQKG